MSVVWQDKLIDGLKAGIRDGDPRKCLVMLHGIGSDNTSFDLLAEHLPGDAKLIAWNAPGYGGSQPLTDKYPLARDYAQSLFRLVDGLGLQQFTLVGHSLGTLIAVEFTALFPRRATRLVLLASAQGYGHQPGTPLPHKAAARLADLASLGPLAFARARAPNLLHYPERQPEILGAAIKTMAAIPPESYAQAVHMLSCGALSTRAAQVPVASLVLVGHQDRITPPEQSRKVHDALQSAGPDLPHLYGEVEQAGHLLHQEQPATVAARLSAFAGWNTADTTKVPA